jgi:hypothetical protein
MLGGQVPYPGASFADLVLSVANEDPTPLGQLAPGLSAPILELVERAMSRDPNQRFSSVEQMGRALSALSNGIEFAADTGDPARTSMTQRPASGSRSRTPLATEFEHVRPLSAAELGKPPTLPMLAGVAVAAVAVIALGTAAYLLLRPPASTATVPHVVAQPVAVEQPSQATGAATQPGSPNPSDTAVNQNVLNPILPGNSGTELPVPNTVRIGVDPQGGAPNDPRWQNLNSDRAAGGVVDPAGLNAEPNDPAQRIRLGHGRASHSQFGSGVSSRDRARASSGRTRPSRSESRRESDDATEASGGRQENTSRFRATHGQGMNADEF